MFYIALHARIHMVGDIEKNMMLKCHYFSAHSCCANTVFFPEAKLDVALLINTYCFELLFGLCRCELNSNLFIMPPVRRFSCFLPSNDLISCLRYQKALLHGQYLQ